MTDKVRAEIESLLGSAFPYPEPGSGFDPMTASNAELASFGLPERPSAATAPEYYQFWQEMLRPPNTFVAPVFPTVEELIEGMGKHPLAERAFHARMASQFHHCRSSRNWSGAYITPMPRPNRFMQVVGAWTVPGLEVPRVPPSGTDRNNEEYQSSTWIGVGGQRSYNTLPQIGTHQLLTVRNGQVTASFEAWWQWWIKNRPVHHISIPIKNFEVRVDDEILASLTVEAPWPGEVRFNIKNRRTGTLVTFKAQSPADIPRLGSTAEWIHERRTKPSGDVMYPLPRCTDVTFRHCLAWSAPDLGAPMVQQSLDANARLVRMVEVFDRPHRSALVSLPDKGNATLKISYREAGS